MRRSELQKLFESKKSVTVTGRVANVIFKAGDSDYRVFRLSRESGEKDITVCGAVENIAPGMVLECTGVWYKHPKYGLQFVAQVIQRGIVKTVDGIRSFLCSELVKGVGPVTTDRLLEKFGEDLLDVLTNNPEALYSVEGVGKVRVDALVNAWEEHRAVRDIMVFLQKHGISAGKAMRIYKTYGSSAVKVFQENPYRLADDVFGIGFQTADRFAITSGIDPASPFRARAGLAHVLREAADNGDCFLPAWELIKETAKLLGLQENSVVREALLHECEEKHLIRRENGDESDIALPELDAAESRTAYALSSLIGPASLVPAGSTADEAIGAEEWLTGITLAAGQRQAVRTALMNRVSVITGGPGVGKTRSIQVLLGILKKCGRLEVKLCAPTGRAAKRMTDTTGAEAQTIHRLLGFSGKDGFRHREDNPIPADVIIADECSMLDIRLARSFFSAVAPGTTLVIVGDVDQLPSVGPGSVLKDIIDSGAVPVTRLTEIYRQAGESFIVKGAHDINAGRMPQFDFRKHPDFIFIERDPDDIPETVRRLVLEKIPEKIPGIRLMSDIQVLSPMQKSATGVKALNVLLQAALNPNPEAAIERFDRTFGTGDKVLQIVNNYEKGIFNGDIGLVSRIDTAAGSVDVEFPDGRLVTYEASELDELTLAYALSIHKSQGSEYPVVIIPVSMQHAVMLSRNLIYTGVTRGRRLVILVGDTAALKRALICGETERYTTLAGRLRSVRNISSRKEDSQ